MTHFDDDDHSASADHSAEGGSGRHHKVDRPRIEAAVREILLAIGEDPDRGGLHDTPRRVAKAYAEVFAGLHQDPASVLSTTSASTICVVRRSCTCGRRA